MKVVCDTSPICYLLLIDQIELLPQLFGQITIPIAVRDELLAEGASDTIQRWIADPPKPLNLNGEMKICCNWQFKLITVLKSLLEEQNF